MTEKEQHLWIAVYTNAVPRLVEMNGVYREAHETRMESTIRAASFAREAVIEFRKACRETPKP